LASVATGNWNVAVTGAGIAGTSVAAELAPQVRTILIERETQPARIENKWAGLRSFPRDGVPTIGFDRKAKDFFVLARQSGYGIQSAPALARLAAAIVVGRPIPPNVIDQGVEAAGLSPHKLERAA
jgi:D-arginine dehydrogenase